MPTQPPWRMRRRRVRTLYRLGLVLSALTALALTDALRGSQPGEHQASAEPTTDEVVARMMETDHLLTPQLRDYTSIRRYWLENKRFGKRAEMTVRCTFRFPDHKAFKVLGEHGSATIRQRVFRRMLESELEASRGALRDRTQVTPLNYAFRLLGSELLDGRKSFILEAIPKAKNAFLFRGRVWVDAEDWAIARIEGSPAQNPSFWVRQTSFVHCYKKFGPFWLAVSNYSETQALIFGRTEVLIEYGEYLINQQGAPSSSPGPS